MNYESLLNHIKQDNVLAVKYFLKTYCNDNFDTILKTNGETLLLLSVSWNSTKITKYLVENSANVNKNDNEGFSPLMMANSIEIVDLLLSHGAKLNYYKNKNKAMNALMCNLVKSSVEFDSIKIAKHLIDLGIETQYVKAQFNLGLIEPYKEIIITDYLKSCEEKKHLDNMIEQIAPNNKKIKV